MNTLHKKDPINNPITEGVIWKQILLFFFPLLLSSFFQQLYNTADVVIVGQAAGKEALSAVAGSAGSVLSIFLFFYTGFASGAAVLAAQFFGAKKYSALRDTVRLSLILSAILGLLGLMICFFLAGPILRAMGAPAETMDASFHYLRIIALGMVASSLYNMGAAVLRALGDVRSPLYILIGTCLANIALDLAFVAVLKMGAPGAALATALCQLLSMAAVLICLRRTLRLLSAAAPAGPGFREQPALSDPITAKHRRRSRSDPRDLCHRILRVGLPLGLAEVMYTFANLILMAVVNGFGTDTVAAYGAYGRIDAIFWMIVGSFGIAITTFVGQNIGAGKRDRVFQCIRDCSVMMFLVLGIVIAILYIFSPAFLRLFTTDAEVLRIGVGMMHFLMPFYFLYIPIEILFSALRGMGDSLIPTIITFFGVCILRSAWGLFAVPLHHTPNMVLAGFPVTWIVTSVAFFFYFRRYVRHHMPAADSV